MTQRWLAWLHTRRERSTHHVAVTQRLAKTLEQDLEAIVPSRVAQVTTFDGAELVTVDENGNFPQGPIDPDDARSSVRFIVLVGIEVSFVWDGRSSGNQERCPFAAVTSHETCLMDDSFARRPL